MKIKWIALPVAAVVAVGLAACSGDVAGPSSLTPDVLFTHAGDHESHQHNGPVWVRLTFTIAGNGGTPAGVNQHPQGKGDCRQANGEVSGTATENTVWFNENGRKTNSKFCEGSTGEGVAGLCIADAIPATYAAAGNTPGSGNENLNFFSDEEGDDVLDQFVHYKANKDWTDAVGAITFDFTCNGNGTEGEGSLALDQFATANPDGGNAFEPGPPGDWQLDLELGSTTAEVTTGLGTGTVTGLSWVFRSRVGE
jgi:hypothetical protein